MEQFVGNLLHAAAWTFGFIFLFAIIGVIATFRWIIGLFMRGEQAVVSGVQSVEHMVQRK
ncbi:MAG TPA: hypothetical protein VEV38_00920 [Candidatus Eremiobacteraceae bacterium]|nr:hypothetical protein [Candidatus Eremiobacteraceae bacterium]